jgi:4-azaleucine resistance transporter AzlC
MREGARLSLPLLPGTLVMAAAFGTLAAQKGLSFAEAGLMSMLVFAGASQMVALEAWAGSWTVGAVLTLTLVTMTVNSRFVLMSASLRPWFADLPAWQAYPALLLTVDANWLLAMRHRSEGGADVGVYVGSGLVLWAFWVAGTMPGHLLGGLVSDPRRFGLDLVLPIFMAAILVPQWRGISRALPWLVAGGAAALAAQLVPGWWFIIIGALAGGIAGGVLDERR